MQAGFKIFLIEKDICGGQLLSRRFGRLADINYLAGFGNTLKT
jgi:hypothetical protein